MKKTIVYIFAILFFIDILSVIGSADTSLFIPPRGSDYEKGFAFGYDMWRLFEFIIIGYAIKLYRAAKSVK